MAMNRYRRKIGRKGRKARRDSGLLCFFQKNKGGIAKVKVEDKGVRSPRKRRRVVETCR
tara:strand:+ start:273 stop:449 length:177 start_codon:yes stop_codon:yes gene_type:complete